MSNIIGILTAIQARCLGQSLPRAGLDIEVRSWRGLGGDGRRIAGVSAKVA